MNCMRISTSTSTGPKNQLKFSHLLELLLFCFTGLVPTRILDRVCNSSHARASNPPQASTHEGLTLKLLEGDEKAWIQEVKNQSFAIVF